jgi:O-antigen/teichoic acid export membrane protein
MSIYRHVAANLAGQFWVALMQLAFVPVYLHYLGREAFGLIGLFVILQNLLVLLDLGLSTLINREMARYQQGMLERASVRQLLRSIELAGGAIALLVLLIGIVSSHWIASHWLTVQSLDITVVTRSLMLIALYGSLRFIESFYKGALLGLQQHNHLNGLQAFFATLRGICSWVLVAFVAADISYFFICQCIVSFLLVLTMIHRTYAVIGTSKDDVKNTVRPLWLHRHFATGMFATTLFSLILTQADKVFLSKIVALAEFGDFMLAHTCATAMMLMVSPLAQSYYPHLTRLYESGDQPALVSAYHQGCQLLTIALFPVALMLIFFAQPLLELWTQNHELSVRIASWVQWLAVGNLFLGLMNMPYMLQLAHGNSRFAAVVNALIVIIQLPLLYILIPRYGADAVAWVWLGVTSIYMLIVVPTMHRKILPGQLRQWYLIDVGKPAAAALVIGFLLYASVPISSTWWIALLELIGIYLLMLIAAMSTAPQFLRQLKRLR